MLEMDAKTLYFLMLNAVCMRTILVLILLASCYSVQAQYAKQHKKSGILGFFRMKNDISGYRWQKSGPQYTSLYSALNQPANPAFTYWQGGSFTSFSENGRVVSTSSFDVQGQIRETHTTIRLVKTGMLSNFRFQISTDRNRPAFLFFH
jgi:hypothetical protein